MPSNQPQIGLIGAGKFSELCLQGYRRHLSNLKIRSVYDSNQDLALALSQKYNIVYTSKNVEDLINDKHISYLIILTPPNTHYRLAKQALLADKHVLVEKPMAVSLEQAEELHQIAANRKLKLASNYILRFHPAHLHLRQLVADKPFGELTQISTIAYLARYPNNHWYWQKDVSGGFFLNTFSHFLDLYSYICGQKLTLAEVVDNNHYGWIIILRGEKLLNNLSINLTASNQAETVTTLYTFKSESFQTLGWLPHEFRQLGQEKELKYGPKIILYQELLAKVLEELINRQPQEDSNNLISNDSLLNSFRLAWEAENFAKKLESSI